MPSSAPARPAGPTVTVPLRVKRILWSAADGSCIIAACTAQHGAALPPGTDPGDFGAVFPGDLDGRVATGAELDAVGGWRQHPKYGQQLRVSGAAVRAPEGSAGLADWLDRNCRGIGPVAARRVVAALGRDAMQALQRDPEGAVARCGLLKADQRATLLQAAMRLREEPERVAHHVWCREHGLGPALTERAWARWGARTAEALGGDPYLLTEIDRAGWVTADALAERLGTDPLAPSRLRAAMLYAMEQAAQTQGHTHRTIPEALAETAKLIAKTGRPAGAVPDRPLRQAVLDLAERGLLIYEPEGDRLALADYHQAEREVATLVGAILP